MPKENISESTSVDRYSHLAFGKIKNCQKKQSIEKEFQNLLEVWYPKLNESPHDAIVV